MAGKADDTTGQNNPRLHLRVLATSDLHGHILPWDDLTGRPAPDRGLAQIASLIAKARGEVPGSLLLDNGDFLNGSLLSDHLAQITQTAPRHRHPMIAAMNALHYDAATLGNHEFSNGLALLRRALAQAQFPIVATNLDRLSPSGGARRAFRPRHLLLERALTDQTGKSHLIRIGILGFLPPQTTRWERRHLDGHLAARAILSSAKAALPRLRRAGADIVIALAHSGIGHLPAPTPSPHDDSENVAAALAALDGIDAVIAGHTHQVFPAPPDETTKISAITPQKPLVMPGFNGSHLAVMDLLLGHDGSAWCVNQHQTELRPVARRGGPLGQLIALTPTDRLVAETAAADTAAMRQSTRLTVGHSRVALHSYFALIGHSAVQTLLAEAQLHNMRALLAGRPEADLPLLVAVAPFKAGGRGGPENYIDIAKGPLTSGHMADLYPHPNSPVALRLTGRELALWLERAASLFHQIHPGTQDACLINPDFPAYNFDMIHGLNYAVDLSQPARFDAFGHETNPKACRIRDLRYQNEALPEDRAFVLVTNSYRASGGAGFAGTDPADVILEEDRPLRDILQEHVVRARRQLCPAAQAHWRFAAMPGTSVLFDSGPGAAAFAADVPDLSLVAPQPTGLLRFRLRL